MKASVGAGCRNDYIRNGKTTIWMGGSRVNPAGPHVSHHSKTTVETAS